MISQEGAFMHEARQRRSFSGKGGAGCDEHVPACPSCVSDGRLQLLPASS